MDSKKKSLKGKRIAIIAADGFEYVELAVPKAALDLAGADVEVISLHGGKIRGMNLTEPTRTVRVDRTFDEADPDTYDALFVPGGLYGPDFLRQSEKARDFVRAFDFANKPIATICHGPWLLVSAELAAGRVLSAWPGIRDDIVHAGGTWRDSPVVHDGNWVSSRGPQNYADSSGHARALCNVVVRGTRAAHRIRDGNRPIAETRSADQCGPEGRANHARPNGSQHPGRGRRDRHRGTRVSTSSLVSRDPPQSSRQLTSVDEALVQELETMARGDRPRIHRRAALRGPRIDLRRAELRDPCFEHARGGADREEAPRLLRRARESVRRASRNDEHLAGPHRPTLSGGLEVEAAFEDEKGLLQRGMAMTSCAGARQLDRLDEGVRPLVLALRPLEGHGHATELVRLALHRAEVTRARCLLGLRSEELETVAREDGVHVDRRIPIRGAHFCDERLEDATRRADGQQAASVGRRAGEAVRSASRNDEDLSRPERMARPCHLEVETPLENDERLLPRRMAMEIDARARRLHRFDHAVGAIYLGLARLEGERHRAELVGLARHRRKVTRACGFAHLA